MDEEKTAFHTPHGVYCYTKMRFGLKNAGATYQRLVDKAFEKQVGRNLEVYVDDLVIKSHTEAELLRDIEETFLSEKVLAALQNLEEMRKKSDFHWTPEAEQAFKQLKQHISELLMLVAPRPNEELIMYLSASQRAVGAVLMTERYSIQTSVYFVSRVLQGPELNYTPMEKLVLALVFAAKRLRSIMLREHNITYRPRSSVKGQILADFLMEKPEEASADMSEKEALQEPWTLFMDGSSCVDGSAAGPILTSPDGVEFTYALRFPFTASNNEAEYEALLAGLRIAAQIGVNPKTEYLKDGVLPDDKKEANKLRIKARQYELMDGIMYRRLFLRLWLRDARDMILKCKDCQVHRPVPRNLQQSLTLITSPWPFYKWGIDIASPFLEGPGKVKFLIVDMDYFTKWIEAKAVATISGGQVKKFVWDNIVCRFGLLGEIVPDNERANRSLGEGIKARLGEGNKKWIKEIPHVFWAHRTMIKSSNGDTPFSLTYGTEAVIPDKMTRYYNARVRGVTFKPGDYVYHSNEASHAIDGGKIRPKWEGPYEVTKVLGDGAYKLRSGPSANVEHCQPQEKLSLSHDSRMDGGKLEPKWEGPYEVTKALGDGAYKLRSIDRAVLSRTWNIANLKKCYL
ncbi:reverse transcriptase domain-containing protein [Tanacetum coccineum]